MQSSTLLRKVLLIASLGTLVMLLAALMKETVFSEWKRYQRDYATLLELHATDELGRMLMKRFSIELKQVVVPELQVVDRCVVCHNGIDDPRMSKERNPHKVHPGSILETHPYSKYGCTICHQGQGRATVFKDAKAESVHWDYPMLPREFLQSSCALCHSPDGLKNVAPTVAEGYALFLDSGCLGCHKVSGTGSSFGPELDAVGAKKRAAFPFASIDGPRTIANWHIEHLKDPQKVVAGSRMKNYGFSTPQAHVLTTYLLSLRGMSLPITYVPKDRIAWEYDKRYRTPLTGEVIYRRFCMACHDLGLESHFDPVLNRYVPTVRNPAFLAIAPDTLLWKTIEKGRPGRDMPAWEQRSGGLLEEEISNVIAYLRGNVSMSPLYDPAFRARGNPGHGRYVYERSCAGCHGMRGEGRQAPALDNVVFQEGADDGYLRATISQGRHGTAMRSFVGDSLSFPALTEEEIADVIMYVRILGVSSEKVLK